MKKIFTVIGTLFFALSINAQKPTNYGYAEVSRGYRWSTSPCGETAKQIFTNWENNGHQWVIPEGVKVKFITNELLQFQDYSNNNLNYMTIHPKYNGHMPLIWCEEEKRWLYPECANRILNIKEITIVQAAPAQPSVNTPVNTGNTGNGMGFSTSPSLVTNPSSAWQGTTTTTSSSYNNTISDQAFDWDAYNKKKGWKIGGLTVLSAAALGTGSFFLAKAIKKNASSGGTTQIVNDDWAFDNQGDTDDGFGGNGGDTDGGNGGNGDTDGSFGGKKSLDTGNSTKTFSSSAPSIALASPVNYGNIIAPTSFVGATATFSIGGGFKLKGVTLDF